MEGMVRISGGPENYKNPFDTFYPFHLNAEQEGWIEDAILNNFVLWMN